MAWSLQPVINNKVLEASLNRGLSKEKVRDWLVDWCEQSNEINDSTMPLRVTFTDKDQDLIANMRFIAAPRDGLDCYVESASGSSPFGRIIISRVASTAAPQIRSLTTDATERAVRALGRDAERYKICGTAEIFFSFESKNNIQVVSERDMPKRKKASMMDPALYVGSYGEEFEKETLDLFDEKPHASADDEALAALFAQGEALARTASRARMTSNDQHITKNEQIEFPIHLGTELQGGIDLFAGPSASAKIEEELISKPQTSKLSDQNKMPPPEPSNRIKVRFNVLLSELVQQLDNKEIIDLICDAYRDVLLHPGFENIVRDKLQNGANKKETTAIEILNNKVIQLATLLAETASLAENQHLETIRIVCQAAKTGPAENLSDTLNSLRPRLNSDFIGYLVYAINDPSASTEWRLVLNAVKDAVYSYLAKEKIGDLSILHTILNIRDPRLRLDVLRQNIENMSDERLDTFIATARNVFDNLLFAPPETTTVRKPDDPFFLQRLSDLRDGLIHLIEPRNKMHLLLHQSNHDPFAHDNVGFISPSSSVATASVVDNTTLSS